ncbi:hypothetical protein BDN72DRAFT_152849 [Pluteus cervinus]|uniref:Uncharacterized protein n=1 Tax=Pluteus cervinus TaxID=181527 RepID=A0ACD3B6N1_9AGAR|nr:hypothetical protein BDN72DRAFT_152849 [Pluteus cervinus]
MVDGFRHARVRAAVFQVFLGVSGHCSGQDVIATRLKPILFKLGGGGVRSYVRPTRMSAHLHSHSVRDRRLVNSALKQHVRSSEKSSNK